MLLVLIKMMFQNLSKASEMLLYELLSSLHSVLHSHFKLCEIIGLFHCESENADFSGVILM